VSTFTVPVVRVEKVVKHPDADTLSITEVEGCPVIFRTGDFQVGDLAIYVPVEAVVPVAGHMNSKPFAFLAKKEGQTTHRIKAVKLRGTFSMGLLVKVSDVLLMKFPEVGDDVQGPLGITKYVEPEKNMPLGGRREGKQPDKSTAPVYDIESHRKYKHVYADGEEVVITEKIHGCNGRFVFRKAEDEEAPRLFVGSRQFFNKDSDKDVWWAVARKYDLATKLVRFPDVVLYGEVYGQVQDLKYGTTKEDPIRFAAFDAFDKAKGRYLDYDDFLAFCRELDVPTVPVLYRGPYSLEKVQELALGQSVLADQIKEGCVIKPVVNRWDHKLGRVITKMVGEQYLLRKGGTEFQ
jgi:RNA ligase (TIGR02306 family)